MVVDLT